MANHCNYTVKIHVSLNDLPYILGYMTNHYDKLKEHHYYEPYVEAVYQEDKSCYVYLSLTSKYEVCWDLVLNWSVIFSDASFYIKWATEGMSTGYVLIQNGIVFELATMDYMELIMKDLPSVEEEEQELNRYRLCFPDGASLQTAFKMHKNRFYYSNDEDDGSPF